MGVFACVCRAESMYLCVEIRQMLSVCVLKMNYYSGSLSVLFGNSYCSFVAWWYVLFGSGKLISDCPTA